MAILSYSAVRISISLLPYSDVDGRTILKWILEK